MFVLPSEMHPAMSVKMLYDSSNVTAFAARLQQYTVLLQGHVAFVVMETLQLSVVAYNIWLAYEKLCCIVCM